MPRRAPHPCTAPGCSALVAVGGRCPVHRQAAEAARGSAAARGYGHAHRAWRVAVLERDGVCLDPEGRHPGEVREATVADHVVPVRVFAAHGEPEAAWTLENGQGLCASCHGAKTRGGV